VALFFYNIPQLLRFCGIKLLKTNHFFPENIRNRGIYYPKWDRQKVPKREIYAKLGGKVKI
jgi:hypothetical protein